MYFMGNFFYHCRSLPNKSNKVSDSIWKTWEGSITYFTVLLRFGIFYCTYTLNIQLFQFVSKTK
uniref:Alternative protein MS4A13 n=1 Tax=Homo sapiens TaxID=9606 RepID=L8E749_HUMAN|nr:alternative protein MS4A13 [Homo sapiens]